MSSGGAGRCHLRSYLCVAGHELRVTARCAEDDLAATADTPFECLLQHVIVRAFRNERASAVHGTSTVGPAAGASSVYVLRRGNDHRGATWFDAFENVVWLCAYGLHRSGHPDDAFQYFDALRLAGTMLPTVGDLEALAEDRAERFAAAVETEAQELLAAARSQPGIEQRRVIGTTHPLGLLVHIVETLEETYVAVCGDRTDPAHLQVLLVALYPDHEFDEWRWEARLPTRPLDQTRAEFCLSIVHG
jgi:hypothetical protein